jgi:hypothetical protein
MSNDFFGGIGDAIGNVTDAIGSTAGKIIGGTIDAVGGIAQGIGYGIGAYGSSQYGPSYGTNPNMLISQYRSQGIPLGPEPNYYYSPTQAEFSSPANDKDWRVKISSQLIYNNHPVFGPLAETGGMIFPFLPTITMSHTAEYSKIDTAHTNYPFYAYKNSQIDDITITGQFTVQDEMEGLYWLAAVHFLRTATKMYFGQGPNIGNPPPICTLNGYGDFVYNNVSCVIKSFNVQLEKDVDYISVRMNNAPSSHGGANLSYVPSLSTITVTLLPVYSRDKIKTFNLTNFANGQLITSSDGKGFI